MNELNYKETWEGNYRDVSFEIVHWRMGWNYYLYIPREQLPDELETKFNLPMKHSQITPDSPIRYYADYDYAPIISDLEWHGGITFYEKYRDEVGKIAGYKLGCDYLHSFDEHQHYTQGSVMEDVKHSIDKLHELVPNLKVRCSYNGKYYPLNETFLTDKNVRVANVNKEKWYKPI